MPTPAVHAIGASRLLSLTILYSYRPIKKMPLLNRLIFNCAMAGRWNDADM